MSESQSNRYNRKKMTLSDLPIKPFFVSLSALQLHTSNDNHMPVALHISQKAKVIPIEFEGK